MGNQYLGLSLFIMLLSFFIVMNALSDFKDIKAETVLTSLSMTFSSQSFERANAPDIIQAKKVEQSDDGDTLDKIQGIFEAQFENFQAQKNRLGTEMMVRVPVEEFERMVNSIVPRREPAPLEEADFIAPPMDFATTLITLMQSEDTDEMYRLDILLPAAKEGDSAQDIEAQKRDQVVDWAEKIDTAGLPQKFLSVGIDPAETLDLDMVYLHFRRYEPVVLAGTSPETEGVQ